MENRNTRFKRLAEKRTVEILNKIRVLGNLSNRSVYDYSSEEVEKIFTALDKATKQAKSRFTTSHPVKFKL